MPGSRSGPAAAGEYEPTTAVEVRSSTPAPAFISAAASERVAPIAMVQFQYLTPAAFGRVLQLRRRRIGRPSPDGSALERFVPGA